MNNGILNTTPWLLCYAGLCDMFLMPIYPLCILYSNQMACLSLKQRFSHTGPVLVVLANG